MVEKRAIFSHNYHIQEGPDIVSVFALQKSRIKMFLLGNQ